MLRELPGNTWPLVSRAMARRIEALARSCSTVDRQSHLTARMRTFFSVKRYVSMALRALRFTCQRCPAARTKR